MLEILVATKNKGKIKELTELLKEYPINLKSLNEYKNISEVEETGKTFAENAKLKAESYAKQTNCWALADDSGLEVQALNNAPGIFSARYSGENSDDKSNMQKLLFELKGTPIEKRIARFVCVIAVANNKGEILFTGRGICNGNIGFEPKGSNGFGYDPIFIPDGFNETFGEFPNKTKQNISHRTKALEEIINFFDENVAS